MDISLRGIEQSDLITIARLANDRSIAKMTASLPHPYTQAHAKTWLDYIENTKDEHVFAICLKNKLIGVIGLVHEVEHNRAELGYWLGAQYWRNGYMSAAAEMAIAYAFTVLGVRRIYARCFSDNPASIRVLEKNGFVREGSLRKHCVRMNEIKDVFIFGRLKEGLS